MYLGLNDGFMCPYEKGNTHTMHTVHMVQRKAYSYPIQAIRKSTFFERIHGRSLLQTLSK